MLPLMVQHQAGGTPNGLWTTFASSPLRLNNTPPVFRVFFISFFLSSPQDERNLEEMSFSLGLSLLFLTLRCVELA
jgi:hypothetical protein